MSVTSSVSIIRRGSGCDGEDYLEVSFRSRNKPRLRIVPARDFGSFTALRKINILTPASRSAFLAAAETALQTMPSTFRVADRSGWLGPEFVWPDGVTTGVDDPPVCLGTEYQDAERMQFWGTLTEWRNVSLLARGNSRVMLAISHAFTGPVAAFLGLEAPAIQLVGAAGVFKTSLACAMSAIWGVPVGSWHQTSNGVEQLSFRRHATYLVLDDFRVDRRYPFGDLRATAIRLLDGRTRGRMDEPSRTFCTPILSTSNHTCDEQARLAGTVSDPDQAALRGRLIDVPLPCDRASMFENLHGRPSQLDLMVELADAARDSPGRAAVAFIDNFGAWIRRDREEVARFLTDARSRYLQAAAAMFTDLPDYDLTRAHGRFATIYAAGLLVIKLGVVRWSRAYLLDAITVCEAAHVAACRDGGRGDVEGSPLTTLRRHVEAHRTSFVDLRDGLLDREDHDQGACPGYINLHRDGVLELLFTRQMLERICGGASAVHLLRREVRLGDILIEREGRPSMLRFIYRSKIPNERVNVMVLTAAAFGRFQKDDREPQAEQPVRQRTAAAYRGKPKLG